MLNKKIVLEVSHILNQKPPYKNYYYLENSEGKAWIIPQLSINRVKMCLDIYQPSSFKGKIFKLIYPYCHNSKNIRKKLGVELINISFKNEFLEWIKEIFKEEYLDITLFQGTPSIHRKTTIQINDSNLNILGYIKLSLDKEVKKIIANEVTFLKKLERFNLNIPKLIDYKENFLDGLYIMAQSTKKNNQVKYISNLQEEHFRFEKELYEKTRCTINYTQTKYYFNQKKYLNSIEKLENISFKNEILKKIYEVENKYKNERIDCSIVNRDFTPWNTFFTKSKLFVFDWEYATEEYPRFYDLFHFFTQNCLLVKKVNDKSILKGIKKLMVALKELYPFYSFNEIKDFYVMYLLDITLFYIDRDPKDFNKRWLSLIKSVEEENEDWDESYCSNSFEL